MTVKLTTQDGVALIAMDDGKANAINPAVIDEWMAVLDQIEDDATVKAVVVTGLPGKFSAGFDLKYFFSHSMEENQVLVRSGGIVAHRLFNLGKPVVAAISGHAIAMGIFLALACDRRIGVPGPFKIGANETVNGMVVPRFAMELIKYRLKPNYLDEAVLQAKLYNPEEALDAGYLDRIVAPEALMETAMQTAKSLAELPGDAYAGNKRLVREEVLAEIAGSLMLVD